MADTPFLNKNIDALPLASTLNSTDLMEVQQGTGVGSNKRTPLSLLAAQISTLIASGFATAAQGAKADSAVQSVQVGTGLTVDNTTAHSPKLAVAAGTYASAAQGAKADTAIQAVVAGTNVTVDNTNPLRPVVSASGGGGGGGGTGWTRIAIYDFAVNGAQPSLEADVGAYSEVQIISDGVTLASTGYRAIQVSVDGGTTWKTSAEYDYTTMNGVLSTSALPGAALHSTATTSAISCTGLMLLDGGGRTTMYPSGNIAPQPFMLRDYGSPINRVRICGIPSSPGALINMTGGKAYIYGRKI